MLEILISSSVLILALALLRLALRGRISARLQYALWLLVALRLLVPVSLFHSPVSVAEAAAPAIRRVESYSTRTPVYIISNAAAPASDTSPVSAPVRHTWTVKDAARYIWYAGMAGTAVWFLLVNIRLARRLRKTRIPYEYSAMLPVYTAPGLPSPCLFGLLRPAVYLTAHAAGDGAQTTRIVTHELTHYRHGDMIWALLRSVCLVVWWFNPLVWLAAALSREDCELACDEGTIKALGEKARFDYGRTLVDMAAAGKGKASDLLCGATTMTGGDKSLRQRVTRIARAPKMSVSVAVAVLAIAAIAAGCAFTGAAKTESAPEAMPEQMTLDVFYPKPGEGDDISTTVSDTQAIQEMYDLYLSLRDKAVLIDENYDMQYGSPIYAVCFFDDDAAEYRASGRMLGFQMWEGGQFLLYNDDASIYEEAGMQQVYYSKEYGALFKELLGKYFSESVEAGAVEADEMPYDREYWEEVARELGGFADPVDIEVVIDPGWDENKTVFAEDSTAEQLTLAHYIYGTDSWRFMYNSDRCANDPIVTIKVTGAAGRVLWIMDDMDELMIEEADGSITWVYADVEKYNADCSPAPAAPAKNVDLLPPSDGHVFFCADMIRHLRSWAQGEHPATIALAGSDWIQLAMEELGTHSIPGFEVSHVHTTQADGSTLQNFPPWAGGRSGIYGQYISIPLGTSTENIEFAYERFWSDAEHTVISNAAEFENAKNYYRQTARYTVTDGLAVNGYDAFTFFAAGDIEILMWYDTNEELIFLLSRYTPGEPPASVPTEELIALAESVE